MTTKVKVDCFKASGKWYMTVEVVIPDKAMFYQRREYLEEVLSKKSFKYYFSNDCDLLGWPFMYVNEEE